MSKFQGNPGFTNNYWYGIEGDYNVLVMDILGPTIEALFRFCDDSFKMNTLMWVAQELISRMETLHSYNFVHRDIKTENLCIGHGKKSQTIFLIDFGLSKRYKCPKTGKHIERKKK